MRSLPSRPLPDHLIIQGGMVCDPLKDQLIACDILIIDGRISRIAPKIVDDEAEILDASGLVVTHGFCDLHAHFREPGREDKETLESGAQAALAGGFTTVCVMPNTHPPIDSPEKIRFLLDKSALLPVRICPVGAITVGQEGKILTEMGAMVAEGAVGFSDDGIPVADSGVMRRALEYAGALGVPVINHAEDPQLRGAGQMTEGSFSTHLGMAGNPDLAEAVMVSRDVQIAGYTGGRLHVPHVSAAQSVEWIRWAREKEWKVTAEVTPHHLALSDYDLASYDTNLKVAPPLRSEKDRRALIESLRDGVIDCIATDHAPHTVEEKDAPFDTAPSGTIGLESAFGVIWSVLQDAGFSLPAVIRLVTVAPRKIVGLEPNLFREGTEAEITLLDPNSEREFSEGDIFSRSRNCAFLGRRVTGKICGVISKGRVTAWVEKTMAPPQSRRRKRT